MRDRRPRHNNRDRLPKGLRNKAFKDPERNAEKLAAEERAVESACDFAWSDYRVRGHLREWLDSAVAEYRTRGASWMSDANNRAEFTIETGRRVTVRAAFRREARLLGERLLIVVVDALAPKTVYCGVEMPCAAPSAAAMLASAHA